MQVLATTPLWLVLLGCRQQSATKAKACSVLLLGCIAAPVHDEEPAGQPTMLRVHFNRCAVDDITQPRPFSPPWCTPPAMLHAQIPCASTFKTVCATLVYTSGYAAGAIPLLCVQNQTRCTPHLGVHLQLPQPRVQRHQRHQHSSRVWQLTAVATPLTYGPVTACNAAAAYAGNAGCICCSLPQHGAHLLSHATCTTAQRTLGACRSHVEWELLEGAYCVLKRHCLLSQLPLLPRTTRHACLSTMS
jgi:hypothetical protein